MKHTYTSAIQFNNICFEIDRVPILNNISGSFYEEQITTLVGPSGAGKTTLLKMCNGLISPTSGEVFIESISIDSIAPTTLRKNIGIVLQNAPIIHGTVFENIALPFSLQEKKLTEKEAILFLEAVGLDHTFLYRRASDLSGGQKQKISIARSLVNKPKVLLLDEITSALDPASVSEIEQLILKINQEFQVTIVWITHNIEQAKRIGDFTWILMEGRLLESGESSILSTSTNEQIQLFAKGVHSK
ncbi:ABC transporter ATP-binding protein [Ureibacillus aquaedulcis]|uniref:Phosphate ABC transporter ATP-binding protein n=1 Tax=Ureibacillus aquaedulcis TaxID=3058421 RepID=A0ABT8GU40_9BACL|nr:phosphate ABC transporter ATP-binding protein [Ureibacillus sp. BA0131]MDN4494938.1 phosphate ABC transporter ATP-binding protein [Ureibacillus sp. BA0131]